MLIDPQPTKVVPRVGIPTIKQSIRCSKNVECPAAEDKISK